MDNVAWMITGTIYGKIFPVQTELFVVAGDANLKIYVIAGLGWMPLSLRNHALTITVDKYLPFAIRIALN